MLKYHIYNKKNETLLFLKGFAVKEINNSFLHCKFKNQECHKGIFFALRFIKMFKSHYHIISI